jgi:hypothetical protein
LSMVMDSRLPAKWRRKSGGHRPVCALSGEKQVQVKIEPVEENLSWDLNSDSSKFLLETGLAANFYRVIDYTLKEVIVPIKEIQQVKGNAVDQVIDVDAELGEEDMDLSSTRSSE